jgi:hypothetical protein
LAHFEIHEVGEEWVVRDARQELARFSDQFLALQDVAQRFARGAYRCGASLRLSYVRAAETGS